MGKLINKDATGEALEVGDIVRIIRVPNLSVMSEDCQLESTPVFQHLVGTYRRIESFNEYGLAWISFIIRRGESAGNHTVAIEPYLLKKKRSRKVKVKISETK